MASAGRCQTRSPTQSIGEKCTNRPIHRPLAALKRVDIEFGRRKVRRGILALAEHLPEALRRVGILGEFQREADQGDRIVAGLHAGEELSSEGRATERRTEHPGKPDSQHNERCVSRGGHHRVYISLVDERIKLNEPKRNHEEGQGDYLIPSELPLRGNEQ